MVLYGTLIYRAGQRGHDKQVYRHRNSDMADSRSRLYNPATNMCLDDDGYGGWGNHLIIWPCNGQTNQMWNIVGYSQ